MNKTPLSKYHPLPPNWRQRPSKLVLDLFELQQQQIELAIGKNGRKYTKYFAFVLDYDEFTKQDRQLLRALIKIYMPDLKRLRVRAARFGGEWQITITGVRPRLKFAKKKARAVA